MTVESFAKIWEPLCEFLKYDKASELLFIVGKAIDKYGNSAAARHVRDTDDYDKKDMEYEELIRKLEEGDD
jgi:hypothetical protein